MPTSCFVVMTTLLATFAAAPHLLQRGQPERNRVEADLKRYHVLILAYRQGSEAPVTEILAWSHSRIQTVLDAIGTTADSVQPWEDVRFKAAAMLHTDAAIRLIDDADNDRALIHLDAGSQILMKAGPGRRPYTSRWYVAIARLLRDRNWLTVAEWFLQIGRTRLPRDGAILEESGTLQELLATNAALPTEPPPPPTMSGRVHGQGPALATRASILNMKQGHVRRLNQAAAWLTESLTPRAASPDLRLHLGRVQGLRGEIQDAHRHLREARGSTDRRIAYLAALFEGALYERARRFDEAERAYREAVALIPTCQVAYIAVSKVLENAGRRGDARDVLRGAIDAVVDSRDEPWWSYFFETRDGVSRRLNDLRRETRR